MSEKTPKNIFFIDQTSEFDHHMVFNASMLKILCQIFPDANIYHCGLPSNIKSVRTLLSPEEQDRIIPEFIPHKKVSGGILKKGLNYLRKEKYRYNHFKKVLNRTTENDWIVLSITTFTSFLWFKRLKRNYQTPTIAVLHGEVSFIYKSYNFLEKVDAWVHKKIFKTKAPNFYYLTLNKIEKAILVKDGYLKESEIFEINHPYLNLEESFPENPLSLPIRIGHIGSLVAHTKNSHMLFELAEKCKHLVEQDKIIFDAVGLLTPEMKPYLNDWVQLYVGNKDLSKPQYLSREDYETALSNLNYAIFFYPPEEYVFRASGAIADFISKETPIIYLKHPIFDYFQENVGEIGYQCNNLDEIKIVIENLAKKTDDAKEKYRLHKNNVRKLKQQLKLENIAEDLKNQIESI
ncbi:hypothetical protein EDM00_00160 [Ornithobacterium rhinotracheale]|uniref:hypothetical protein n=1 Tax=Ornithobacterium rhinotracheale TaxID=28251 RepID=UPI00129CD653|nr:hypothetical protein [Ornithobacterium rhinotracheale]MRI62411.1 hypothetical protein [Ornithobacterium rhinotracheale]